MTSPNETPIQNGRASTVLDFDSYDGVTSLDQVRDGFNLRLPRIAAYERFKQWYKGDYRTLYSARNSLVNGLTLFAFEDLVKLPAFEVPSKFYQDSILARRPQLNTEYPDVEQQWKEHAYDIFKALDKAIEYWSYTGAGVLISKSDGTIQAIDPAEHIPVQDPQNKDRIIGHVLAYQWRERDEQDLLTDRQRQVNRVNVVRVTQPEDMTERATSEIQTYHLAGPNGIIGPAIGEKQTADVTGVFMFGNRRGWYHSCQDAAAAIMVRVTLLGRLLNRFSDPHLWLPPGTGGSNVTFEGGTTQQMATLNAANKAKLIEGTGALIEASTEGPGTGYGYIQGNPQAQEVLLILEWLANWIHLGSGVSPTSWGVNVGRNESGEARKQAALRSAQLISSTRQEIERLFPSMLVAAGITLPGDVPPNEVVSLSWADDPFGDAIDDIDQNIKLYEVGAIDINELREAAKRLPFTEEQMNEFLASQQQQTQSNDAFMRAMAGGRFGNDSSQDV